MEIDLLGKLELLTIQKECGLANDELCAIEIGNDEMIHLLFAQRGSQRRNGALYTPTGHTRYQAVTLIVHWQGGGYLGFSKVDFGILKPKLHMIQKLHEGFLLVGARSHFYVDEPERNALVMDQAGHLLAGYCLGDGIAQCLVDRQNRIITSYFDEGVFGNYGWKSPLGASGLRLWSATGECLWQNKTYPIYDCYAINLDEQDHLWFYYYQEFHLVRTDYQNDLVMRIEIYGSNHFLIHPTSKQVLFDGGYGRRDQHQIWNRQGSSLVKGQPVHFCYNREPVSGQCSYRGAKVLFLTPEQILYFGEWQ